MTTLFSLLAVAGVLALGLAAWRARAQKRKPAEYAPDGMRWQAADGAPAPAAPTSILEVDRLKRIWFEISRREKVELAILAAALLAIAQFFTTAKGLSNFIPWLFVAVMAAIGIQLIVYLGARLVAERSASKAYLRRKRLENEGAGEAAAETDDLRRARAAFRSSGRFWTPVMFAAGFWISVLFSFDALFDHVYTPDQQLLVNLKVARSTFAAMFDTIQKKIGEDRDKELADLRKSEEWKAWNSGLNTILITAANSKDMLQISWNKQRSELDAELKNARIADEEKATSVAKLKAALAALSSQTPGAAAAQASVADARAKDLQERETTLQKLIDQLQGERGEVAAKREVEFRAGGVDTKKGKRRKAAKGPVWRELNDKVRELDATLAERGRELADVKRQLAATLKEAQNAQANKEITATSLQAATSELETLRMKVVEIEGRQKIFLGQAGTTNALASGASDMVLNIGGARDEFVKTGERVPAKAMFEGCNTLLDMLTRHPQTKESVSKASCEATALAPRIRRLAALEEAEQSYRVSCKVDDTFNAMPTVKQMADRALTCAGLSSLPFTRIRAERNEIDRVVQENSPSTSHFERTIATLRRFDTLAWLAFGIAFSIDFLVLAAAMLGARAAVAPLVKDGHVASKADLDDIVIAQNIDPSIYEDDPPVIRNQKAFLTLLRTGWSADANGSTSHSFLDLRDVPPEFKARISAILHTYAAKKLAYPDRHRPGVYRIENSMIVQVTREVGLYELDQQRRHGTGERGVGYQISPPELPGESARFEDFTDPLQPRAQFYRGERPSSAAEEPVSNGNGGAAAWSKDDGGRRGGWSQFGNGDDTKPFTH